jgi:hypothetical protein
MKAELNIPDLSDLRQNTVWFAVTRIFVASGPDDYAQYALVTNYIRLVDLALDEYQDGRELASDYWEPGARLGAMIRAAGYFEDCLSNVKRALNHLKVIRSNKDFPLELKEKLPRQLKVLRGDAEKKITNIRDGIQHLEKDVENLNVKQGNPICLMLEFERLMLGDYSISYQEISEWLRELHQCATNIHGYYLKIRP